MKIVSLILSLGIAFVGLLLWQNGRHARSSELDGGLSASMTDEQILRALELDPLKLQSKTDKGVDGTTKVYSDEQHEIWITRSVVSGVIVMRMKPKDLVKTWELGKP